MTRRPLGASPATCRGVAARAVAALLCACLLGACTADEPGDPSAAPAVPTASDEASVEASAEASVEQGPSTEASETADARPEPAPVQTAVQTPVVPPAGEGDLEPAPTPAVTTLPPVALDAPAAVSDGLQVRLAGLEAVDVTGRGPGQLSGPAVAVTVEVSNRGAVDLDVAGLAVSLAYADTEAGPVDGPPADPVDGAVPAGATVSGSYVFLVPEDQRGAVTIRVGLASQPVAVFTGSATT